MKDRMSQASSRAPVGNAMPLTGTFSATLAVHLLMCSWATENWRWYIDDMENQLDILTGHVLSVQVDRRPPSILPVVEREVLVADDTIVGDASDIGNAQTKDGINIDQDKDGSHPREPGVIWRSIKGIINVHSHLRRRRRNQPTKDTDEEKHPEPPSQTKRKLIPRELPPDMPQESTSEPTLTFSDLQRILYIEEKAQEARKVLHLNLQVLKDLREHYKDMASDARLPADINKNCQVDLFKFDRSVRSMEKDMQMSQSQLDSLLQLLANRKDLVSTTKTLLSIP